MSIDEFLVKLREKTDSGVKWKFVTSYSGMAIRCERGDCPIIAVAGQGLNSLASTVGVNMGMTYSDCEQIMMAADDNLKQDPVLRVKLLEACGLK